MRKILGFAIVVAFLAAGTARAQAPSGFSLGARLGYGISMGDFAGDNATYAATPMSDMFKGQVPLQLDAMYRFDPSWSIGVYLQYAKTFMASAFSDATCIGGVSCSASDVRFGVQAHYRFPSQGFVPWVGLGLGGEWNTITLEYLGASGDIKSSGFEYLNLQIGGDWLLSPIFRLGPYVQLSLAQYDSMSAAGYTVTFPSKSMHEWLQFGLKGTFDL